MDPSGLIKKIEWNGNICVKFYLFLFHHLNFMSFSLARGICTA